MMEGRLILSLEDYNSLLRRAEHFDMLKSALYENATLSWQEGHLNLDRDAAEVVLKAADSLEWSFVYKELLRKKKEREERHE